MREGWSYKKLGEVCEIVGGSTPKTNIAEYWEGDNMWVTPAELIGEKYFHHTERTISDAAVKSAHLQLLPVGTVLLSSRAPIGKVAITTSPMYCNQGFKNAICSDAVKNDYVYWYLLYSKESLQALGTGATFKEISKKTVSEFSIPIPPLTTQQQIVSELDLLSHILDQKRQQLKEYDALAESIFYDMFGDPVENPKGFEIVTLNDVCQFIKDGTHQTPRYIEKEENGVNFLSAKDVVTGSINWDNIKYIPQDLHEELYARIAPQRNDVLLCKNGTYGIAALVETDEIFDIYVSLALLRPTNRISPKYLVSAINTETTMKQFKSSIKGIGVPNLHLGEIKKTKIILPPLTLQRSFAAKIESIEHQKQLLRASINETEMLFQSRMDYWFNS